MNGTILACLNRMRRVSPFVKGFAAGVGVLACGAFPQAVLPAEAASPQTQIGLIYEARASDQPWSAAMYDAAQRLAKQDSTLKFVQSYNAFDTTTAEPVARQMISAGSSVLVLHSFALNDVAKTLSKEFPKVAMSVASFQGATQPNLSVASASYLQIGYSDCYLLAKLSKTHKIAFVGAMPIAYATELLKGCQLGASSAFSGTEVLAAYSNSFDNQQATREQAQALLERGADGLFPASGTQDSLGGFQLCEQRQTACVGWASSIRRYAPKYGVASAVIDWSVMLKDLVAQARSGKLHAETYDATFDNNQLVPQPFESADAAVVPADVQRSYLRVISDLAAGKIDLPQSEAHPCCK